MTQTRRLLTVQPLTATDPQIGRALWMLEDARHDTDAVLDDLADPVVIDWKPDWALHSIGTLLYHIALVEADWLHVEVQGNAPSTPYSDAVTARFRYPMRSHNALTPITGGGLSEHRQRLAETRRDLLDVYSTMSLDEYRRPRALASYDVTPEWVLHHLAQHEAEHRSEIAALRTAFQQKK